MAVTVGPGGNLTGLTLTERAYQQQPHQLAALIMRLAAQAQQQVGAQMLAAFSGLVGADSPALDVVTPFLAPQPADEEPEPPAPHPDEPFDAHPGGYGPPVTQPPPTGEIQRRPRRRPDPGQDVEPDYDEGDFWNPEGN